MGNLRGEVLLAYRYDGYDKFRKIYNDIIEDKIREGRQGIEQEQRRMLNMQNIMDWE